nr:TRIC cation channel family protein [Microcella daejeonensis]
MTALFVIPLWADLLAVGIGALQGALFAAQFRDRRLDLLGVAIIGIATGFGGGILRDILLAEPLAPLASNWYLLVATAAALLGMLLERLFSRLSMLITGLDALTLGLFGAIGTTKALALGLPPVAAVFVGVLAAVGGSILRDLLLTMPIALMHVGSLYALAAAGGTIVLTVLLAFEVPVFIAAGICVVVTFGVRILSVLFGWSLPEQRRIERLPRIPRPRLARRRTVSTATGVIHLHPTSSIPVQQQDEPVGLVERARTGAIRIVRPAPEPARGRRRSPIPGASRSRR